MKKAKILYVEDDESLSFVTTDNLEMKGFEVVCCDNGRTALEIFNNDTFDICILDVMLPELDGFKLAETIRKYNVEIPIIFLTAKSLKEDKIKGLRLGADDYIVKPYSIEELLLKVEVFYRRNKLTINQKPSSYKLGMYKFDYPNLKLFTENDSRQLTQREADLLKLLLESSNQVIKREHILETLWGENDYFLGRSLDVFISRLRKYLKKDEALKIENIHGVGFRLLIKNASNE
ncbi:MAG: response regulator transcription factor [Bacteroidota bacterium]